MNAQALLDVAPSHGFAQLLFFIRLAGKAVATDHCKAAAEIVRPVCEARGWRLDVELDEWRCRIWCPSREEVVEAGLLLRNVRAHLGVSAV